MQRHAPSGLEERENDPWPSPHWELRHVAGGLELSTQLQGVLEGVIASLYTCASLC